MGQSFWIECRVILTDSDCLLLWIDYVLDILLTLLNDCNFLEWMMAKDI